MQVLERPAVDRSICIRPQKDSTMALDSAVDRARYLGERRTGPVTHSFHPRHGREFVFVVAVVLDGLSRQSPGGTL